MSLHDRRIDVMKIDVEGAEEGVMNSGRETWERTGMPRTTLFECSRKMAEGQGYSTLSWASFTQKKCYLDLAPSGAPGWFSAFIPSSLPWVAWVLLASCGGANHALVCP